MRAFAVALGMALVIGGAEVVRGQDYDGCSEQFYDSKDEPCGGGHQHTAGKRDESSLDRARHRHRYLEDKMQQLKAQVDKLTAELEQHKKAEAK